MAPLGPSEGTSNWIKANSAAALLMLGTARPLMTRQRAKITRRHAFAAGAENVLIAINAGF